jgi:ribosomal protein S18 acetylase RimI-like enzyme
MKVSPDSRSGIHILSPTICSEKLLFRVFDHASPIGYARLTKQKSRRSNPDNTIDMFDPDGFDSYELKMIEVAQNYRQQGVGTTLLQEVIRYCRACNIKRVTGEIKGDAGTLGPWYRKNGFKVSQNNNIELQPAVTV